MKALILGSMMVAYPAHASGIDMLPLYDNAPKVERVSHHAKPKPKPRKTRRHKPAAKPEAHAFRPPPVDPEAVTRCLAPVRVVGSQDVRPDAAESSAQKAWAEYVRWTHGEAYQDFANATNYQKRCSRSSIGEALGQYFTRCEIVANPCRPGMKEGTP